MFADNAEPNPDAQPVTPVELRNAYISVFKSMADAVDESQPAGLVQDIESATHTIYMSGAPLHKSLERCAERYAEFWDSEFAAASTSSGLGTMLNYSEVADGILAPYIQSYALSGLAFEGSTVLAAANRFGKGKTWVKDILNTKQVELPSSVYATMSKRAVRTLMNCAAGNLRVGQIDASKR